MQDTGGLSDTLAVDITLGNVNDNAPVFAANADAEACLWLRIRCVDTVIGELPGDRC